MEAIFKVGSYDDPQGQYGLASLASGLMDEGAEDLDSQEFRKILLNHAIDIHFDAKMHEFSISLKTTKKDGVLAAKLLEKCIKFPRFDKEPVERIKNQLYSIIKSENENLYNQASQEWRKIVYPNHPYSRSVYGTIEGIKNITKRDLLDFAHNALSKDKLVIGVSGDIAPDELAAALDRVFGDIPDSNDKADVADIESIITGDINVVEKDIPQSIIVFGHEGIKRTDKDFYPAYVMNYILGAGSFSSRLMNEVRVKRGLAYTIQTYLSLNKYSPLIAGTVGTRNDKAGETIKIIREEWSKMAEHGVTQQELEDAKNYLIGSFPMRFNSTTSIAAMLAVMQAESLPIDFLDKRNSYVEAVSLQDIKRVASTLLNPQKLTMTVLGKPTGL
jgi:zinc protease